MIKPVWSHVLALNAWVLKKAHSVARKPEHILQIYAFPPNPYLTVQDILSVSFAISLNHR